MQGLNGSFLYVDKGYEQTTIDQEKIVVKSALREVGLNQNFKLKISPGNVRWPCRHLLYT